MLSFFIVRIQPFCKGTAYKRSHKSSDSVVEQVVSLEISPCGEKLCYLDSDRDKKAYKDDFFRLVSLSEPYWQKESQRKKQEYIPDYIEKHMPVSAYKLGYFPERRLEVMGVCGLSTYQRYEQDTVHIGYRQKPQQNEQYFLDYIYSSRKKTFFANKDYYTLYRC